jgi:hypothetical protein
MDVIYTVLGRNNCSGVNIWGEKNFTNYNSAEEYRRSLEKESPFSQRNNWTEYFIEITELVQ